MLLIIAYLVIRFIIKIMEIVTVFCYFRHNKEYSSILWKTHDDYNNDDDYNDDDDDGDDENDEQ